MELADPVAVDSFVPFRTSRLTLRAFVAADAAALAAYRNDPDVARYQDWPIPYPASRAERAIAATLGQVDPLPNEWWQIAIERDGELAGDVGVGLDSTGSVATIGYTLALAHHGAGVASEAVGAVIDRLFARTGVHRVQATVDPANLPSIRVLERLGFASEGVARQSVEIRGEWLDDGRYGLLRADHDDWSTRPPSPPADVRLVEITPANALAVLRVKTFEWQQRLVSPNVVSFADALVPEIVDGAPVVPWYRAIEADGEIVGFVMMAEPTATHQHPYLWRLLVDRRHQRRHIGGRALGLAIDQALAWGANALTVSWMPGIGTPQPFYLARGFVPTGGMDGDEIVAQLTLEPAPLPPVRPSASAG